MSQCLILHIGEYYTEASFAKASELVHQRYSNARWSLEKILTHIKLEVLTPPKQVVLNLEQLKGHLLKGFFQPPAFVTNQGFEDWLKISWPEAPLGHFFNPIDFLDPNYCFGISQRTTTSGHFVTQLTSQEIEFLVAKLKMAGVNCIAIGLMNSHQNPEQEILLADTFRKEGIECFCSSDLPIASEKERWSWALFSAALHPIIEQLRQNLAEIFNFLDWSPELYLYSSEGVRPISEKKNLANCLIGTESLLSKRFNDEDVFYCGLETFFSETSNSQATLRSPWHFIPKNLPWPRFGKSLLQPSLVLSEGLFSSLAWTDEEIGFEPGPICLGKGLKLTWLDLAGLACGFDEISSLYQTKSASPVSRIREQLLQIAPKQITQKNLTELEKQLLEASFFRMFPGLSLREIRKKTFSGPLGFLIESGLRGAPTKQSGEPGQSLSAFLMQEVIQ